MRAIALGLLVVLTACVCKESESPGENRSGKLLRSYPGVRQAYTFSFNENDFTDKAVPSDIAEIWRTELIDGKKLLYAVVGYNGNSAFADLKKQLAERQLAVVLDLLHQAGFTDSQIQTSVTTESDKENMVLIFDYPQN